MKLEWDKAALEAVEAEIDVHFSGNQENWDRLMTAIRACVPAAAQRRIERAEGCTFAEWLDEVLYKWDGRSVSTLKPLLEARAAKVP